MNPSPATPGDPFDLARFANAQAIDFAQALAELRAGTKESHWMWYVFPQFAGLGESSNSRKYAIRCRAEARAYLGHPLLGARLRACSDALLSHARQSAHEILGAPDDVQLQSCATLFDVVAPADVFAAAETDPTISPDRAQGSVNARPPLTDTGIRDTVLDPSPS